MRGRRYGAGDMVVEIGGGVLTVRGPRAAVIAELRAPLRVTRGGRAPWRRLSGAPPPPPPLHNELKSPSCTQPQGCNQNLLCI